MKKIILTLGSLGLIATPITTLVSCGDSKEVTNNTTNNIIRDKISNLIKKLPDNIVSTKFDAILTIDVASLVIGTKVEPSLVGLPSDFLTLEDGMSASYTVNTIYSDTTNTIKLNLKISSTSNNSIFSTKVITIKSKYDFSAEKNKFRDLKSTKLIRSLIADISTINNITDKELGITTPSLASGVTATYSIANKTFTKGNPKTVTVHLNYDGQTDTTTFNLKPSIFGIVIDDKAALIYDSNEKRGRNIFSMVSDGHGGFFVGGAEGKLDHIDASGNLVSGWKTKTLLNNYSSPSINSIISDKNSGFWVGGDGGRLDHIDASGNLVEGWSTKTLLGDSPIYSMISDGQNGFLVGGKSGKLDHIDANGNTPDGWTTITLLGGKTIQTIISDGHSGFWVGGDEGKLDHIDGSGNLINGWTTKTLLGGVSIYSMISDGKGGFLVGGAKGRLDHIDANGNFVHGWFTNTLLGGINAILSMVADGHNGFFVSGTNGELEHIDNDGSWISGDWFISIQRLLGGSTVYSMVSDGHDGFWASGEHGKLNYFVYEP